MSRIQLIQNLRNTKRLAIALVFIGLISMVVFELQELNNNISNELQELNNIESNESAFHSNELQELNNGENNVPAFHNPPPPDNDENNEPVFHTLPPPDSDENNEPTFHTLPLGNDHNNNDNDDDKQLTFKPNITCDFNVTPQQEQFITYFPHSGFHNQRIELENAMFIAWYTNRTLIMPPVIDGGYISWAPTWKFLQDFERIKSDFTVRDCKRLYKNDAKNLDRCLLNVQNITLIDWDELYDLSWIEQYIRLIKRKNFSFKKLLKLVNISDRKRELYLPLEKERYHIKYYDWENETLSEGRFGSLENLCSLRTRPEKLLHFSSLFGTGRIFLSLEAHVEFREQMRRRMVFQHPLLKSVVDTIVDELGGFGNYIGVHLRIGGYAFETFKKTTIRTVTEQLINQTRINQDTRQSGCAVIFIATDKLSDPDLRPLKSMFPCALTLANFTSQLKPLELATNPADGASLYRFLVPIVDVLIAAYGDPFYGTPGSTFSSYARNLHYWMHTQHSDH